MADDTSAVAAGAVAAGGCLCGAVRYALHGPLRPVVNCHCMQCRRTSGHFVAVTAVARSGLHLLADEGLRWFASSETARRGFCGRCGSSLFWDPLEADYVAVTAGTLDQPSGLRTERHIFVGDKGDYYELDDGLEQLAGSHGPGLAPPQETGGAREP